MIGHIEKVRSNSFPFASGLEHEEMLKHVGMLPYWLVEVAEAVLKFTNATEAENKVYDNMIGKFDPFLKLRKNVMFERARSKRTNYLDYELVEQYVMELNMLADNCDYEMVRDEMVWDKLVIGISDGQLSEHLHVQL